MNNQQQTTNKAFGGLKPLIRRLHFYAGVFIGPFILVAALSGAAYAVAPTLENVVYGDIIKVQPSSQTVTLQSQIDSARAAYPDMEVSQVWPATKADDSTRVLLVDESLGEERLRSVFVNPGDGKVIGDEPSYSGLGEMPLRRFISEMHESMFLGTPGEMYSELAASWLWFVPLGGLVLWWSRVGGRKIFTGLKNPTKKHQLDVALDGEESARVHPRGSQAPKLVERTRQEPQLARQTARSGRNLAARGDAWPVRHRHHVVRIRRS